MAAALFVWMLAVCSIPNIILSITEPMAWAQRAANIALPVGLWWLLLSLSRKIGSSSLLMFPVMFFAAFQLVLLSLYGRSVIAVDMFLNLVTTNPREAGELLGNMGGAVVLVCVLYLPPIVGGIIACHNRWRLSRRFRRANRTIAWVVLGIGVVMFGLSFTMKRPYRPLKDLYPLNVLYNAGLAVDRTAKMTDYVQRVSGYKFFSAPEEPTDTSATIVVLVIGETSRADRWQEWGYDRPTMPDLSNDSNFVFFKRALSESNTTHKSVPMLLSHLSAETFADSIYDVRSVISAFKEAGYSTAFISNQRYNHSFIDSYGFEADTCLFIKETDGGDHFDMELPELLARHLSADKSKKQLVVLHTYGSHFSYADRYPEEMAYFTPDRPLEAKASNRETLDNAYNNTIRYTSLLLDSITNVMESVGVPSAMIYTSDHGEDIFDDSRNLFLHASPEPSAYQIYVPFMVWLSPDYAERYPSTLTNLLANSGRQVSSSKSFFHTAIDLGRIRTAVDNTQLSVADSLYAEPERMYLNDHNEGVRLSETGFQRQDYEALDRWGIKP